MLYTGVNHFNWQVNNFSDAYVQDVSFGTVLTADGSAHTKGSDTALLTGIAYDCFGIALCFGSGNTDATIRRQMTDLLIDPTAGIGNAGSSWTALINNIYTNSTSTSVPNYGHNFYFPMFIPAGSAIGARVQDVVGGATSRIFIRLLGQPTRPDLLKVGTKVQTIGATTASTTGVTCSPGTDEYGSYSASMGTLTNDAWWWQIGIGSNDTTMTVQSYRYDVSVDATAKYIAMQGVCYSVGSVLETSSKAAMGEGLPIRHTPAGTDVYTRAASVAGADSTMTTVVYAVS